MEPNLSVPMILQHLVVSLIPWLIVMITGGGIGYGFASLLRHWIQTHPDQINILSLFPWRSIATWIALVVLNSPLMAWKFGLGPLSGSIAVGIALILFIIPWFAYIMLRSWYPLHVAGKVIAIARLAAVLSIALPVFLNTGVGYFIWRVSSDLNIQQMILGYMVIGALLLGTDLLFGVIQFAVTSRQAT